MIAGRSLGVLLCLAAVPIARANPGITAIVVQDPPDAPRITLELLDTDIRDALRMVAKQGQVNLVMSNKVTGTITLELKEASLQETLDAIVSVGGFEYTVNGNIVTVSTLAELLDQRRQREEYRTASLESSTATSQVLLLKLRYVDADRVLPMIEKLLGTTGTASLLKTADHVAKDYYGSNPAPAAATGLQIGTQLSSTSQGQPARSHTLVVVDTPERLDRIRTVVESIDVKPVQVLIEARFVEVALDENHKLGIDWNVVARAAGAATPHTYPFGDTSLGSFDPSVSGGSPGGVFPAAPNSVTTPTAAGLFTFGALDLTSFSAILEMIKRDSRVQVVSNPRIVVGDRHTATILVGERYPILSANVSEFGTVTEELDHYEPIGVQLEVSPSVLNDDEIELLVRPSTSSLGPTVEGSTGLSVARINSRQIDTSVIVKDGQTIVLGGLITGRDTTETRKVPILGAIPLVGRLFTQTSASVERVDLAVFLTVTVIQEHGLTEAQRKMFERTSLDLGGGVPPTVVRSPLEYSPSHPQY